MAFSKLKAFLKKAAARTVDDLWNLWPENPCHRRFDVLQI
jgi:hypothetical protein